jgi:Amt family ammonium transporter
MVGCGLAFGNAGMAVLVTHTGVASGALAWLAMEWWRCENPSMRGIVTAMVAGLDLAVHGERAYLE